MCFEGRSRREGDLGRAGKWMAGPGRHFGDGLLGRGKWRWGPICLECSTKYSVTELTGVQVIGWRGKIGRGVFWRLKRKKKTAGRILPWGAGRAVQMSVEPSSAKNLPKRGGHDGNGEGDGLPRGGRSQKRLAARGGRVDRNAGGHVFFLTQGTNWVFFVWAMVGTSFDCRRFRALRLPATFRGRGRADFCFLLRIWPR